MDRSSRIVASLTRLTVCLACGWITLGITSRPAGAESSRPNIVWIMSEDNSKHYLRHFDDDGAPAPHIESMAQHGITFDRAFSNAPVCSVARTTLITCCYGPRIGTQYHRRSKLAQLPTDVEMFPAYLRAAGYFTTNNAKEDYNAQRRDEPWDQSGRNASWKNRPNAQTPFFHVQTFTDSHESRLHFSKSDMQKPNQTASDAVRLQPYFPDTDLFRYTRARYHDRMMIIDDLVGGVLEELKTAGELENTFVFYFGDHGGVLPRSKGYAYESGLHVPLVVRVGENVQSLAGRAIGTRTDGFVEFVDFGATVLALAGVDVPDSIDGKPFLGPGVDAAAVDRRDEAFGYADRFDEKYEMVRTLRIGDWKYMRCFEGYLPDGLQNNYRYKQLAFTQWRQLHQAGKLNDVQSQFFAAKPAELLFDLSQDPHEIQNLAASPEHQTKLAEMRSRLMQRLTSMPDLSLMPEAVLYEQAMDAPVPFGQEHRSEIASLLDTANLALQPFDKAQPLLEQRMAGDNPWQAYWALTAASQFGKTAASLADAARPLLNSDQPLVQTRAAEFLAIVDDGFNPWPTLRDALASADNDPEASSILNTAVYVRDFLNRQDGSDAKLRVGYKVGKSDQAQRRLDYLNDQL
ncbi:sulfatase family protein [Crateriforma conspicua]|nr:sulfatase [Crateriforma conspicua]